MKGGIKTFVGFWLFLAGLELSSTLNPLENVRTRCLIFRAVPNTLATIGRLLTFQYGSSTAMIMFA